MAYLVNMPKTCRDRCTRPEHALDLIDSIKREFDKGLSGGIFDPTYILPKLQSLHDHVKWLERMAHEERADRNALERAQSFGGER